MKAIIPELTPHCQGVYKYTFDTGHFYIGSSVRMARRMRGHAVQIKMGRGNKKVKAALAKGVKCIRFEVLELVVDTEKLRKKEYRHIRKCIGNKKLLNVWRRLPIRKVSTARNIRFIGSPAAF